MPAVIGFLLATVAAAVTPGGLRLEDGVPVRSVRVRQVLVVQARDAEVAQTLVRGQFAARRWGVDGELAAVHTWTRGWSSTGLGQLRLGARHWFGTVTVPLSVGLETAFPVAPRAAQTTAWGSLSRETLRGGEVSMVSTVTFNPDHPTTLRGLIGWFTTPYVGWSRSFFPQLAFELAAVQVMSLTERLGLGLEAELVHDLAWFNVRPFGRVDLGGGSVDLGLQLPLAGMEAHGLDGVQVVGQGRLFFR